MNYLDVKKKYPDYQIIQKGYKDSFPFYHLSGITDTTEILGIEIIEKPIECIDITHLVVGGKKKANSKYKGIIYIWYKEGK